MNKLHLTPTRKTLLQEVAAGNVVRSARIGTRLYDHYRPGYDRGVGRRLSGRCAELEREGWIELVDDTVNGWTRETWGLTEAGRAVLDGAS